MASTDRVVYDLELGRGFGYGLLDRGIAGFSVAVTWDDHDGFIHWDGPSGRALVDYLLAHREIVGFNLVSYDNEVVRGYLLPSEQRLTDDLRERTTDLHALLHTATGQRWSLEQVARETLGVGKLPAPVGNDPEAVASYCERDVELTRDLHDFVRAFGVLYVGNREWGIGIRE